MWSDFVDEGERLQELVVMSDYAQRAGKRATGDDREKLGEKRKSTSQQRICIYKCCAQMAHDWCC